MTSSLDDLRRATPADLELVGRLLRRMVEEQAGFGRDPVGADLAPWDALVQRLGGELASDAHLFLLAGPASGLLAARLDGPDAIYAPKRLLHVSAVYVEPARRRRGLARRLLEEALAWGRAQGCVEARLNVMAPSPARTLYRAFGFEDVRVEMRRPL